MSEVILEWQCQKYDSLEVNEQATKLLEAYNKMLEQSKDPANNKEYHGICSEGSKQ